MPAEPSRYWAQEFVPQETFDSFSEQLRDFDPVRLLGLFDGDVLIQNPRRDDEWPLREYERLADDADGAEVKWYPDYGHHMGPEADTDRQEWLAQKLPSGEYDFSDAHRGAGNPGDFREHAGVLRRLPSRWRFARQTSSTGSTGWYPGGESTAIMRLARIYGLEEALQRASTGRCSAPAPG